MPTILGEFTPTERRILDKLQDGVVCPTATIMSCQTDSLSDETAMRVCICRLRKKLRTQGLDIVARRPGYQLMSLISQDE